MKVGLSSTHYSDITCVKRRNTGNPTVSPWVFWTRKMSKLFIIGPFYGNPPVASGIYNKNPCACVCWYCSSFLDTDLHEISCHFATPEAMAGLCFWYALSCTHDCSLRDWSKARPSLTWLATLVGVAVGSRVRNTFSNTLKFWNS